MRLLSSILGCGLVCAMALVGCQAAPLAPSASPTKLNIQIDDQPQGHQAAQSVTFGVRWPESKGQNIQVIPDGARLVRFSVSSGAGLVAEVDVIRDPNATTASKSAKLFPGEYSVIAKAHPDLQVSAASLVLADGGSSFTVTEGQDTGVSITLTPRPSPSPTSQPSPTPTPSASPPPSPTPSPSPTSSPKPSPTPPGTETPSPSPTATTPTRTVNIKAETLLGLEAVSGVRIGFQDVNGDIVGTVTTGSNGRGTIALPAVRTPPYWGAYYKLVVTPSSGTHYSVATSPDTGGTNDFMVPAFDDTGWPADMTPSVVISIW